MTGRWDRIKELFAELADATATQKHRVLEQVREDNTQFAGELERLLRADRSAGELFLAPMVPAGTDRAAKPIFSPDDMVADRYRIEKHLGSGGMGEVYRAMDLEVRTPVALKVLLADLGDEAAAERLRRELRIARSINHPNLCRVYDIGRHGSSAAGRLFFTMELLEGELLNERLRRRGKFPVKEALPIALQIADGLAAAHQMGVMHRDLKPGNVMMARSADGAERVVILDFGLADFENPQARLKLTRTGLAFGTPAYMAPEQFRGEASPASDVYAFGALLREMADVPERCGWFTSQRVWRDVVQRCVQAEPERRYATAAGAARALRAAGAVRGGRRRVLAGALAVMVLAVFGGVGLMGILREAGSGERGNRAAEDQMRAGLYWTATRSLANTIRTDASAVMARMQLAYAWMELEEWDRAQEAVLEEQLLDRRRGVSGWDQLYVEGVRLSAARKFAPAAAKFEERAKSAGPEAAASAWVDAGRAYIRAEKTDRALECYRSAIRADPKLALAWHHLAGVSIQRQEYAAASKALLTAEEQFRADALPEAVAEVLYRRAQMYAFQRMTVKAEAELQRASAVAGAAGNPHQMARCKLQSSIVLWQSGEMDRAVLEAQEARRIAQQAGLESLVARSYLDLGTAQFLKADYASAEENFLGAYHASRRLKTRDLEGRALLSLGSLFIRMGRIEEGRQRVSEALPKLEATGRRREAFGARTLLGRAMRDRGEYDEAAKIFSDQLAIAQREGAIQDAQLARESLASVMLRRENYAEAAALYGTNFKQVLGGESKVARSYAALNYGSVLWRIGNYAQAQELFGTQNRDATTAATYAGLLMERARMELSLGKYGKAIALARSSTDLRGPDAAKDVGQALLLHCAALISLGRAGQGLPYCEQGLSKATMANDLVTVAENRRWQASGLLAMGRATKARPMLETLVEEHRRAGQKDSLWRTQAVLAMAAHALGDRKGASAAAAGSEETLSQLIRDVPAFGRRPDVQALKKQLSVLK